MRARARRSYEWQRARRLLSTLCLFTGHLRPADHEAVVTFGHQGPVPTPGSASSPEVAEIREIREQIRRASVHARRRSEPGAACATTSHDRPVLDDVESPRARERFQLGLERGQVGKRRVVAGEALAQAADARTLSPRRSAPQGP